MIDLGSIAGLYEHEHELHAYCFTATAATCWTVREWCAGPGIATAAANGALLAAPRRFDILPSTANKP